jgi:hypothetical protein
LSHVFALTSALVREATRDPPAPPCPVPCIDQACLRWALTCFGLRSFQILERVTLGRRPKCKHKSPGTRSTRLPTHITPGPLSAIVSVHRDCPSDPSREGKGEIFHLHHPAGT